METPLTNIVAKRSNYTLLASRSSLSLLRDNPPLGFLRVCLFLYFLISAIMVDDVTSILVNMKLTSREEEVIEILDEGRKEGMEKLCT